MPSLGTLALFSVAAIALAVVPGPAVTYIVTQSVDKGRRAGLVAVRNWTFLLGPSLMPGINALLLGYLLYRSGLVPRLIPTLGLIGAPLLIISVAVAVFRGKSAHIQGQVLAEEP